ncbi:hypothetical protein EYF80_010525 [Liparis tanakae]|uniref:Uncharacterized protein n=1 Tax=Liparis tanakae TaxID=230148 RepID=A0A4Z2IML4_9TELE|nr:hypothetical protein EYF80_010525 [Liparis tanakae]
MQFTSEGQWGGARHLGPLSLCPVGPFSNPTIHHTTEHYPDVHCHMVPCPSTRTGVMHHGDSVTDSRARGRLVRQKEMCLVSVNRPVYSFIYPSCFILLLLLVAFIITILSIPSCSGAAPLVFVYSVGVQPLWVAKVMVVRVVKVVVEMVGVVGQRGVVGHRLVLLSYPEMHYRQ